MKTKKVRITKSSDVRYWYADSIGAEYTVSDNISGDGLSFIVIDRNNKETGAYILIKIADCVVLETEVESLVSDFIEVIDKDHHYYIHTLHIAKWLKFRKHGGKLTIMQFAEFAYNHNDNKIAKCRYPLSYVIGGRYAKPLMTITLE